MKKQEVISTVASLSGATRTVVADVLKALDDVVFDTIAAEDEIRFGWGRVYGVTRPAHMARNPRTGETIEVPEKHGQPKCKFFGSAKE